MKQPLISTFLQKARQHDLQVQRCRRCDHAQLPPRIRCEACGSQELAWRSASGEAKIVSYTTLHRAPPEHLQRVPYVYALVELAEGPRMVTNLVDADETGLHVGQPVEVVFERTDEDGQPWPDFRTRR